ncbi:pectate lyase [uncultured Prevotella sp.]|uniref:pectate lyase n=1 Tax=uncultured Prevotella sp. TaxID=159272 RepID=UPI0026004D8A|nr:pectate lyase [uncultured Prevotella sp.]
MKTRIIMMALTAAFTFTAMTDAQGQTTETSSTKTNQKNSKPQKKIYKTWTSWAAHLDPEFFSTAEATRIGDNLLLYQQTTGGWPKNIDMAKKLSDSEKKKVEAQKTNVKESTIDNRATSTEIIYLSKLYNATGNSRYKDAVMKGMQYLFDAQYDNGGWPQFYPRNKGYYTHITYNDDAMINVMKIMRDASLGKAPFAFLPDSVKQKAKTALDKGIDCILKTQYVQNGKLTVWCAQHDENTLKPANARAFELASLSGQESDDIVLFLMSLSKPSQAIVNSVEAAVEWFHNTEIDGYKREYFKNADGKKDWRLVKCADGEESKPLWARFYTLDGNRPFFCDRDGVMKFDVSEIDHERRNGYSWYNSEALKVFKKYDQWSRKYGKNKTEDNR